MSRTMIDETGHQYGYLAVLEPAPLPNRNKMGWLCQCQLCGRTKIISGSDLRNGKYTSCGCKRQNIIQEQPGTMYGFLEVLRQDPTPARSFPDNSIHWICKCHLCGSICSISGRNLRTGAAKSCGCIKSYGEALTAQFLNQKKIPFKKEYTIKDLKDINPLRFDFAILDSYENILGLIEFNGSQHYDKTFFTSTDEDFELRQKHDLMKIEYCEINKLSLYIISNEANFNKNQLEERLPPILQYIIEDLQKENKYAKISYIDLRDLSS